MVSRERRRIEGTRGAVVCDTRYFPIAVLQWHGQLDAELARAFGRWMDELLGVLDVEDLRVATLGDLTRAEPLSSEARRVLVELRDQHQRRSHGRVVIDVIVSDRPHLRGVTQTLSWINPRAPAVLVSTMDEGLRRCREALQSAGISAPSLRAEELEQP
jgi:hypothetical protein